MVRAPLRTAAWYKHIFVNQYQYLRSNQELRTGRKMTGDVSVSVTPARFLAARQESLVAA